MDYKLYYWRIPFRGNFIRLILEDANQKYIESSPEEIINIKTMPVGKQVLPAMAPPFLHDLRNDVFLSQMPSIVMYLSQKLGYHLVEDPYRSAVCLKLILDSNDVLAEITNLNGTMMWDHETWKLFRTKRLRKWFEIFEETGKKFGLRENKGYMLSSMDISTADLIVYALFGMMTQCLPDLKGDFEQHAPYLFSLCKRVGERPNIQKFIKEQTRKYGQLYCGGQIERSIRKMLDLDSKSFN
ncbi:MAG: glutathione S-transferase family protein [Spirochaetota bacterium]